MSLEGQSFHELAWYSQQPVDYFNKGIVDRDFIKRCQLRSTFPRIVARMLDLLISNSLVREWLKRNSFCISTWQMKMQTSESLESVRP